MISELGEIKKHDCPVTCLSTLSQPRSIWSSCRGVKPSQRL